MHIYTSTHHMKNIGIPMHIYMSTHHMNNIGIPMHIYTSTDHMKNICILTFFPRVSLQAVLLRLRE
jgi:hypothetical protein